MGDTGTVLKVFLVSPEDVADQRRLAAEQVRSIAAEHGQRVEAHDWNSVPPGLHSSGAQEKIDDFVDSFEPDLLIGLFWSRFGQQMYPNGPACTEHEIRRQLKLWRIHGRPQVWVYFAEMPIESFEAERVAQLNNVVAFREELRKDFGGLFPSFKNDEDLRGKIKKHLDNWLPEFSKRDQAERGLHAVASANSPAVRSIGITEQVGDIHLKIEGALPELQVDATIAVSVRVSLNVPVTNDASATSVLGPELCTASGFRIRGASVAEAGNSIRFDGVPLDVEGGLPWCRISGIRANASAMGEPARYAQDILAFVSITGPLALPVADNVVAVGSSIQSVESHVTCLAPEGFPSTANAKSLLSWRVEFAETTVGAFRDRFGEQSLSSGTRFLILLFELPDTVDVLISRSDRLDQGGVQAVLVEGASPVGAGGSPADPSSTLQSPWKMVGPSGGHVFAVWEFCAEPSRDLVPIRRRRVTFDLVIVHSGEETLQDTRLMTALTPLSCVAASDPNEPIPRFVELFGEFELSKVGRTPLAKAF